MARILRNDNIVKSVFSPDALDALESAKAEMSVENVVYCSFENSSAKSGGLFAVVKNILPRLGARSELKKAVLFSPYFRYITDKTSCKKTGKSFVLSLGRQKIESFIYINKKNSAYDEYFIDVPGFFEAANPLNDPYIYDTSNPQRNSMYLLEDAIVFSMAAPKAAAILGLRENVVFHVQDWQTALTALTCDLEILKGGLISAKTMVTLHNPYDVYLPKKLFTTLLGDWHPQQSMMETDDDRTVLGCSLPFVDCSVTTVSTTFAKELLEDPCLRDHFTPHLTEFFREQGMTGINNGPFVAKAAGFDNEASLDSLAAEKKRKRGELLEFLGGLKDDRTFGTIGYGIKNIANLPDEVPLFFMSGRLDTFQKGYDIAAMAIEGLEAGRFKFILSPMTAREELLAPIRRLAEDNPGDVIVLPFRISDGYSLLLQGSTYALMPSVYEPFGAAVEFLANGTPVIARDTGGLAEQINDECGILYSEDQHSKTSRNIQSYANAPFTIEDRRHNRWADQMSRSLKMAIMTGADVYANNCDTYYSLIQNGLRKYDEFSWDKAVDGYLSLM